MGMAQAINQTQQVELIHIQVGDEINIL